MASGAAGTRQRMINLMYLVFIALLALNVSQEVLLSFVFVKDSLEVSTRATEEAAKVFYDRLSEKHERFPERYEDVYTRAMAVRERSDQMVGVMEDLRETLRQKLGVEEFSSLPYMELEQTHHMDSLLFEKGKPSERGQRLVELVGSYGAFLREQINFAPELVERVDTLFSIQDVKKGGVQMSWLEATFRNMPLVASLTTLSKIESDIRSIEKDIAARILDEGSGQSIPANRLDPVVIPLATEVPQGEEFVARLVLNAQDPSTRTELALYDFDRQGQRRGDSETLIEGAEAGVATVSLPARLVGKNWWGGVLRVVDEEGNPFEYEFRDQYTVLEAPEEEEEKEEEEKKTEEDTGYTGPMALVGPMAIKPILEATNARVLFRGIKNVIYVSYPGLPPEDVSLSGPGLRRKNAGQYEALVDFVKGDKITYTAKATHVDGREMEFANQTFEVRELPRPIGLVKGQTTLTLAVRDFMTAVVDVSLPGVGRKVPTEVTGFTVYVPGKEPIVVKGNRLHRITPTEVGHLRADQPLLIDDITIKLVTGGPYKPPKATPIAIRVTQ